MKAVILAAGEGTRLRPFTETRPKVMLPLANKPILHHILDALSKTIIDEAIIVVGYKKEQVMNSLTDIISIKTTIVTQDKQIGTGHALLQAQSAIDDDFIVIAGDNFIDATSINHICKQQADYAIMITQHKHPSSYGVISMKGKTVDTFQEKPEIKQSQFISTGVYKFPPSVFPQLETMVQSGKLSLPALIQQLLKEKKPIQTVQASFWRDVIYPWDMLSVNEALLRKQPRAIAGMIEKGVVLKGPVSIGKNTRVSTGSYLIGPVVIGENCEIGPNVTILPSTSIGNHCQIKPYTCIENSVIMDHARIGSHTVLSQSVLDADVSLGHHCSVLVDDAMVRIDDAYKNVRNMGMMIGAHCRIGSNVVIQPGVIIAGNCKIASLTQIQQNLEQHSIVV